VIDCQFDCTNKPILPILLRRRSDDEFSDLLFVLVYESPELSLRCTLRQRTSAQQRMTLRVKHINMVVNRCTLHLHSPPKKIRRQAKFLRLPASHYGAIAVSASSTIPALLALNSHS
jgi:hypothetical protein